ncbi:MAG: SH3 domain-containing protein [Treponema sp.]|jgi:hypothetical protein|nr:SH3 domain-containing protein [Treponema sp.]
MGIYDRDWYRDSQKIKHEEKTDFNYRVLPAVNKTNKFKNKKNTGKLFYIIPAALIVIFITAVVYNIISVQNQMNEEYLRENILPISVEIVSRLGPGQTLGIIGNIFSVNSAESFFENERVLREFNNIIFDWYAPIKLSPVLGVSKEAGWLIIKNRNKTNNTPPSSSSGYAYVRSDALNVRSGPSANYRIISTLEKNTRVQIIEKSGVWVKIKHENIEGYVNSDYLSALEN